MFSVNRPRGKYSKRGKNSLRIVPVKCVSRMDVKNRPRCQEKATAFIQAVNFAIGRDCGVRYKKSYMRYNSDRNILRFIYFYFSFTSVNYAQDTNSFFPFTTYTQQKTAHIENPTIIDLYDITTK